MTNSINLVLVEDEVFFAESVAAGLKNLNYKVKVYNNGEEMLDGIINNLPDAIILDYHLNNVRQNAFNGRQVLEILSVRYPQIPVIILSNMSNMEEAVTMLKQGAIDFIPKDDIFFDNLQKAIDNIFKLKGLMSEISHLKTQTKRYRTRLIIVLAILLMVASAGLINF